MHSDGSHVRQLTPDSQQDGNADWSPSGDKIVFSNNACTSCPNSDLFVMNPAGHNIRQLTANFGNNAYPKWSPDGSQITFSHEDPPIDFTHMQIYTMNANGTSPFNVTNNPASSNRWSDWGNNHSDESPGGDS
jgi:Tol biopolymer transport system component